MTRKELAENSTFLQCKKSFLDFKKGGCIKMKFLVHPFSFCISYVPLLSKQRFSQFLPPIRD